MRRACRGDGPQRGLSRRPGAPVGRIAEPGLDMRRGVNSSFKEADIHSNLGKSILLTVIRMI